MAHIFKVFETSTGNVSEKAASLFDADPENLQTVKRPYMLSEYGWLFTVPDSDDMDSVYVVGCDGFTACIKAAQDAGCNYLLFDNLFEPVDGLTVYDW